MNSLQLVKNLKAFVGWPDKHAESEMPRTRPVDDPQKEMFRRQRELLREQDEQSRDRRMEEAQKTSFPLEIPKAPFLLRIEVVNLCNADCVFCTYQYQKRAIETMSFDIFKHTVDQFTALGGDTISFTPVVGEALVDRDLEEKAAYVKQFPQYKRLELWTNAILLTRERFESLVEAGINDIFISTSGFSADEYKLLYRNSGYARVLKNLTDIAQSSALKNIRFTVKARTGKEHPELDPDYIKLNELNAFPIIFQRDMFSWHDQIKEEDLPGNMFISKAPKDQSRPCLMLWAGHTVMSDGEMTLCGCTDTDGAGLPLGNVKDVPLDAHFKDGSWAKIRDGFVAGNPPDFCKGCDMYFPV